MKRAMKNLPIDKILCEGITFKRVNHRQKWQFLIDGEVLFTWPNSFASEVQYFTYEYDYRLRLLYAILKRYLDTPRNQLLDFDPGYCNFGDILRASDKRISPNRMTKLLFTTNCPHTRRIISYRLSKRNKHAA